MKKMLIFGYTLQMGGAEKLLVDTIKLLNDKYEIDLYLLEKKGILLSEIPENVNVHQLKKNIFMYLLFRFVPFFRKYVINKIAKRKKYDYAIGYIEGRSATWVNDIKSDVNKIAWIHCDVSKFDIGISLKEARKSYSNMDKIVCVSNESKTNFCDKYDISKNKVCVINCLINDEEIKNKADLFEVNNEIITFLNVAKMRDEKGQDRLINAARYLKKSGYNFKIQLIGDGPNYDIFLNIVEKEDLTDVVEMLGLQVNPYPYIKNCDYFILPSKNEGYGIALKEALILKKRIIATDTIGPREILENGKYGLIISNTDDAVIEVMEDILNNPKKYDYLDKKVRNYDANNEKIISELMNLFEGDKDE